MKRTILLAAAVVGLGACTKTDDGKGNIVVDKPVGIETQKDTLHPPKIEMKTDTITTPTVGMKKDTIIVDKPVVGTKQTVVKVPVVTKKKP